MRASLRAWCRSVVGEDPPEQLGDGVYLCRLGNAVVGEEARVPFEENVNNALGRAHNLRLFLDLVWRLGVPWSATFAASDALLDPEAVFPTLEALRGAVREREEERGQSPEAGQQGDTVESLREELRQARTQIAYLRMRGEETSPSSHEVQQLREQVRYLRQQNAALMKRGPAARRSTVAEVQEKIKGVDTLSAVLRTLLQSRPLDAKASDAINNLLVNESGRRIFTMALERAQADLGDGLLAVDTKAFLTLSSLMNSVLTGMELDRELDLVVLDGVRRLGKRVGREGASPKENEFLMDTVYMHPVWSVQRFWDAAFFSLVTRVFSAKFGGTTLHNLTLTEEERHFARAQLISFGTEMVRWRRELPEVREFVRRNAILLQLGRVEGEVALQKETKLARERVRRARSETAAVHRDVNLMRGWLSKRGDKGLVRSLKRRYFRQVGHQVLYFDKKEEVTRNGALGSIDLRRVVEVRMEGEELHVRVSTGRTYVLVGEGLRDYWLPAFQRGQARYATGEEEEEEEEKEVGAAKVRGFAEEFDS